MPCNPSGIYGKVVWFCFSEGCYWEKFWQNTHTEFITQALQRKSNASSRSKHNRWETVQTPRHLSLIHSFSLASDWQSVNKKKKVSFVWCTKNQWIFSVFPTDTGCKHTISLNSVIQIAFYSSVTILMLLYAYFLCTLVGNLYFYLNVIYFSTFFTLLEHLAHFTQKILRFLKNMTHS